MIVTCALPLCDGSAWLVARSVTGFPAGTAAGARYSTLPETAPPGAAQGFVPGRQTCPTLEFPLAIPLTPQLTAVFDEFRTLAMKLARVETGTLAEPGETVTKTMLTIVTVAEAVCGGLVWLVAWIVTGFAAGTLAGAVNVDVLLPLFATVPSAILPPVTPLTSQVIAVPAGTQSVAANVCASPRATLAIAGETLFALAHPIVTLADAAREESATLVAVTLTDGGEGGDAGAVYCAASGPVFAIVPAAAFPPATPLTLQMTAALKFPLPLTVAVKFCVAPVARLAALGETFTTTSLSRLTVAAPLAAGSATLVAVIARFAEGGSTCGPV